MPAIVDGPLSHRFWSLPIDGGMPLADVAEAGVSAEMAAALEHALEGACGCWGIPFAVGRVAVANDGPVSVDLPPTQAQWLVFMHTSDQRPLDAGPGGIIAPTRHRLRRRWGRRVWR